MEPKLITFLTVCRTMNYRAAAEQLHLTQPAVTKQIQALEQVYQTKLFTYTGHKLYKTKKGTILEKYAISLQYNYEEMLLAMQERKRLALKIGATKTIGDYVLDQHIIQYLKNPDHELTLTVDNTRRLLRMLDDNELDFAVIEGIFDKSKYGHRLYRMEPFTCICHPNHPLAGQTVTIEALLGETLILRENGSGTRQILAQSLTTMGYGLQDFKRVINISSFKVITEMVQAGIGISFLYEAVTKDMPAIATITVSGITSAHEFNIVYSRNTPAAAYAETFLEMA